MLCRVLIVDDNADLADAMSRMLGLCGYRTSTAYSGRIALRLAREFRPEIVLLDIGLPDLSGYEVALALRTECNLDSCMIIAISATDPDERYHRSATLHFDHYFIKPVKVDDLLKLLSHCDS